MQVAATWVLGIRWVARCSAHRNSSVSAVVAAIQFSTSDDNHTPYLVYPSREPYSSPFKQLEFTKRNYPSSVTPALSCQSWQAGVLHSSQHHARLLLP